MTQPFADALTWVPKSRALGATLGRAHDLARAQGHGLVTLEHLLLALIEDPDAAAVLLACNIDLLNLNTTATAQVQTLPADGASMPEAAPGLQLILEYAVAAARQSRRTEVNGAIVLAAIVGEGKSEAARLLHALGITFEGTVQALRRASAARPASNDDVPSTAREAPSAPEPQPMPPPAPQAPPPFQPQAHAPKPQYQRPQQPPDVGAANAATGPAPIDDDPVTTARRRVEAIRNGQAPPAASAVSAAPVSQPPERAAEPAAAQHRLQPQQQQSQIGRGSEPASDWAPPPHAPQPGTGRPIRMPPPVPPIIAAPIRQNGGTSSNGAYGHAHAPWADAEPTVPTARDGQQALPQPRVGSPIEPARVAERVPTRIKAGAATTIEARIARSAVLGTAAALNAASPNALTRALTVRLKAPAGGFHVEPAAPETQWFDTRGAQREDDEVRWRWVVTPHGRGVQSLQLAITMRTIAADGVMIESVLPEHQVSVRITSDYSALVLRIGGWAAAALLGAALAMLASGGLMAMLGALGR